MKYKISNVHLYVCEEDVIVGVALGEENNSQSPNCTELITNSEYEDGLKSFKYGSQKIGDMVLHCVGHFDSYDGPGDAGYFKARRHVDQKWIRELSLMGYDTSKLINIEEESS